MATAPDLDLRRARQEILDRHSAAETAHDLDGIIATFHHPRYEIVPTGEVHDGEAAVRAYHAENFKGMSDFYVRPVRAWHADDAIIEEARVGGTHDGTYHGLPPTGRKLEIEVLGIYLFEEDRLVCERVYYDSLSVLMGLGVARDPDSVLGQATTFLNHPVHLGRTFGRDLRRRLRGGAAR